MIHVKVVLDILNCRDLWESTSLFFGSHSRINLLHALVHQAGHGLIESLLYESLAVDTHCCYQSVCAMMLIKVRKEEIHSYGCCETCEDNHDELQGHTGPRDDK